MKKNQFIAMAIIAILAIAIIACKEDDPPAHVHQWEWTVTKPATYTEEGSEIQTCSCGATNETRPIPKKIALNTELTEVLDTLAPNTAETPYTIELNLSNNDDVLSLKEILDATPDKFVILDLSSSTITEIPDNAFFIWAFPYTGTPTFIGIILPDSVTRIGDEAFYYCLNLAGVTIGKNVTDIGAWAFSDCDNLTSINVSADNTTYSSDNGMLYNKDKTTLILCPSGKTTVTMPDSVTRIGDNAFNFSSKLTNVTIGKNVTSIGKIAFSNCTNLTNIIIPDSVESIEDQAFERCNSLTSISIPDSVTSMGKFVFTDCSNLVSVNIGKGMDSIALATFSRCTKLNNVTIPANIKSILGGAFQYCSGLTSIVIPATVESLPESGVFYNCTNLTSITFQGTIDYDKFSATWVPGVVMGYFREKFYKLVNGSPTVPSGVPGTYTTTAPVDNLSVWELQE
jgi:hypothetical protein